MQIFNPTKDVSAIHREIDGLEKYQTQLLTEKEILVADLEGYESPEYEHFKTRVLAKEKIRIALVRMTVAATEDRLHERLQGQWNECVLLERNKENVERDIAVLTRKISDANVKLSKLKKQLNAQIERNQSWIKQ